MGLPGGLRGGGGRASPLRNMPEQRFPLWPGICPRPVHLEADPVGGGNPERPLLEGALGLALSLLISLPSRLLKMSSEGAPQGVSLPMGCKATGPDWEGKENRSGGRLRGRLFAEGPPPPR